MQKFRWEHNRARYKLIGIVSKLLTPCTHLVFAIKSLLMKKYSLKGKVILKFCTAVHSWVLVCRESECHRVFHLMCSFFFGLGELKMFFFRVVESHSVHEKFFFVIIMNSNLSSAWKKVFGTWEEMYRFAVWQNIFSMSCAQEVPAPLQYQRKRC